MKNPFHKPFHFFIFNLETLFIQFDESFQEYTISPINTLLFIELYILNFFPVIQIHDLPTINLHFLISYYLINTGIFIQC